MIITTDYFYSGELFIPNARNVDSGSTSVSTGNNAGKLSIAIDKYERELLINCLGVSLYNQLSTIISDDTLDEVGNEKWKSLVVGETYVVDGKTYIFDGLIGYSNNSFIANYVFCKYMRNDDMSYTTTGTVRDTTKNATSVSATPKYIDIWSGFIRGYQGGVDCDTPRVIMNSSGEIGLDYTQQNNSVNRSLIQYILDKNSVDSLLFPDANLKFYKQKNSMGI